MIRNLFSVENLFSPARIPFDQVMQKVLVNPRSSIESSWQTTEFLAEHRT